MLGNDYFLLIIEGERDCRKLFLNDIQVKFMNFNNR